VKEIEEEKEKPIRAAIYVRVSTADQAKEGISLEEQERVCRDFCKAKGWEIYKVYKDAESGRNIQREELTELFKEAQLRLFDVVVAHKLDRMSRSLINMYEIVEKLKQLDIKFVSFTESFDTTGSTGRLMFNILASFAEFESDRIGERAYMGMLGKAKECNYNGGTVPEGYRIVDDKWVIDEEGAAIVRFIFDLYYSGDPETKKEMGCWKIAEWLNKKGYRTKKHITKTGKTLGGKAWNAEAVRSILSNPICCGTYTWNKYRIKRTGEGVITKKRPEREWIIKRDALPSIIPRDIFDAVQERLKSNRKINIRGRQENYMFSGLLYFHPCGVRLEGWKKEREVSEGKECRVDRYYRCNPLVWKRIRGLNKGEMLTEHCKDCRFKSIRQETIESFLIEQFKNLKYDLPEIKEVVEKIKQRASGDIEIFAQKERELLEEKNLLESKRENLYFSLRKESISLDEFSKQVKMIVDREREIESEITTVQTKKMETVYADSDASIAENLIVQFADCFDVAPSDARKNLLQAIIKKVDIEHNGKVHITYSLPLHITESSGVVSSMAA